MNAPSSNLFNATERSIGAILVDEGRLKAEDAERIIRAQREHGLRFGDAAIKIGLVTEDDIRFALSRQFDYPYLQIGESNVAERVVAAYTPFSPQVEALRALRSQLMLRWFSGDGERKALAIVSPERGDGRSWVAANLAVVFSQLGERTLLIDADLRKPSQHNLFGLDNSSGLSSVLVGRGGPEVVQRIPALLNLSVLPSGPTPPNPQELLARPLMVQLLKSFSDSFDVILIDTSAGTDAADGQTVSVRASGALIVSRCNKSKVSKLQEYSRKLGQASATVVGSVLNNY